MLWRATGVVRSAIRQHLENDPDSHIAAEISTLLGLATLTDATRGLLGMGRDVPDGRMRLRGNARLDIDWSKRSSRQYFARVRATMRHITDLLGGSYMGRQGYNWAERVMTVHPLGGCPMGRDPHKGVVDPYGRVFGYPDLYISDGSVMPGPVGPNPALTIAAFAERCADRIVREEVVGDG